MLPQFGTPPVLEPLLISPSVVLVRGCQPEVLKFKHTTLAAHHVSPIAMLEPVGVDLREDWGAALIECGFQSWEPTAWLVEGLLPYVPSAAQRRLVSDVTALSAPRSRLAAEAYPSATTHLGPERMAAWRENTGKILERLGVGVDVTTLTQHDDPTDAADLLAGKAGLSRPSTAETKWQD